jgi:hypothetical protein
MPTKTEMFPVDQAANKIVAALDRNTAALLTVAAEMLAFSLASKNDALTGDEINLEVRAMFNRFLTP